MRIRAAVSWGFSGQLVLRTGSLWLFILLSCFSGEVNAQEHLLNELKLPIRRGGRALSYRVKLLGGIAQGGNIYDFSGKNYAELVVEMRLSSANRKNWPKRAYVGIKSEDLQKLKSENLYPTSTEQMLVPVSEEYSMLRFRIVAPGDYIFSVPFYAIDSERNNLLDSNKWPDHEDGHRIRTGTLKIIGLKSKEDKEAERILSSGTIAALAKLARDFTAKVPYREQAENAFVEQVEKEYAAVKGQNPTNKQGLLAFINALEPYESDDFPGLSDLLRQARNEHDNPILSPAADKDEPVKSVIKPKPTPLQEAQKAWSALPNSRDSLVWRDYLTQYEGLIPQNDTIARDSLRCWAPAGFKLLPAAGAEKRIRLINFHTPAYYDMYAGRLTVDDDLLRDKHLLSVEVLQSDRLVIVVGDKVCPDKEIRIPLDNLMSVEMQGDTLAGTYEFTFEGGNPPYRLRLYPEEVEGEAFWERSGIQGPRFVVREDSLQLAQLEGRYRAEAFSEGSDNPVGIAGGFIMVPPPPPPAWLLPVLILLAVGVLAVLILVVLRRGGQSRKTIFDEA